MNSAPAVRIQQGETAFELNPGASEVEVNEGILLGAIEAPSCPSVELDDVRISVSWNPQAKLAVWSSDLTNQVGFHRLSVRVAGNAFHYDFRTRTAKATWEDVRIMAEACGAAYLGYKRQFTYMAANGTTRKVRLPQIHYAWLRERLPEIEQLVLSINARPATRSARTRQTSLCSKGLSVPATNRLLRDMPHLLEARTDGPIQIAGQNYWPSRVIVNSEESHSQLDEHMHIAEFLRSLACDSQDLASVIGIPVKAEVERFLNITKTLRTLSIFRGISFRANASPTSVFPTKIQRTDRRYGRLRELQAEYGSDITDNLDYSRSIRANVRDAWEIYQTFVAHVIGNALGLTYTSEAKDLRKRSPQGWSMASEDWRLYFDTKPPAGELPSWRDKTVRPAEERPDITLLSTKSGQVLLLDAKFKLDAQRTRAKQADLFEMHGYLNSFGVQRGGILYPGTSQSFTVISANGNGLLELPIRATQFQEPAGVEGVHHFVREALCALQSASSGLAKPSSIPKQHVASTSVFGPK